MKASPHIQRTPSSRKRRYGRSPLALRATVSLAFVVGVMAVVLLQGGSARAQELMPTSQGTAGIVSLTFDDGPVPGNTPRVLDVLRNYRVKATFFVTGQQARWYPDLVWRAYSEGHSVQNHTYTHPNLTTLSNAGIARELRVTNQAIEAAGVPRPYRFRPPYGATNATVSIVRADLGLFQTMWSVDPRDWGDPPAWVICNRVVSNARPGSIMLLHDGSGANTADALPCIIEGLRARGYGFGKL